MDHLATLTVAPGIKKLFAELSFKQLDEGVEKWYRYFYSNLRMEMESYFNADLKCRIAGFSKKYPQLCRLEKTNRDGLVSYVMDKSRLSLRLLPPMSEVSRLKIGEYSKQHGFQTSQTV